MANYVLTFASEKYGVFTVERLPGELNWRVFHDGIRIGEITGDSPSTAILEVMLEARRKKET